MLQLYNLLFEGMLKIPLILSERIKKEVIETIAAKWLLEIKENSKSQPDIELILSKLDKWTRDQEFIYRDIVSHSKETLKSNNPTQISIQIPIESDDIYKFVDVNLLIKKIDDPERIEISVENSGGSIASSEIANISKYGLSTFFSYLEDNISEWFNDIDAGWRRWESSIEDKENNIAEAIEWLTSITTEQTISSTQSRIKTEKNSASNLWGDNFIFEISSETLADWMPGNINPTFQNPDMLNTKLLYKLPHKKTTQYPKLWVTTSYQTAKLQKFITITGEEYQGVYKGYSRINHSYAMDIVVEKPQYFSVFELNSILNKTKNTIEHELGHFVQDLLKLFATGEFGHEKNKDEYRFGVSSKNLSKKGERLLNYDPKSTPHGLRDVEFYTKLRDEYATAKENLELTNANQKLEWFKNFVGIRKNYKFSYQSEFFKLLKDGNPLKWEKAVKELYKELMDSKAL